MNARRQIAVALWIIVSAAAVIVFKALPSSVADYQDFKPYYVGSLALRRGVNPYDGDFETVFIGAGRPLGSLSAWERSEPLLDTPAWLIFFEPFTFLKPATAYWAWATFNMLCLAAALFVLISDIGPPGADGWTVAALMLLYPPISINFWFAQSEVFLLLIFALALRALRRRHDWAAGVMLAAAALLRAYPLGMLGYLIAKRNWRATGYCLATCVIGSALAVALLGFQPIVSFARLAVPGFGTHSVPSGLLRHPANLNLGSFVQLVFGYCGWAFVTGMAIELLMAGFAFAITAKVDRDSGGESRGKVGSPRAECRWRELFGGTVYGRAAWIPEPRVGPCGRWSCACIVCLAGGSGIRLSRVFAYLAALWMTASEAVPPRANARIQAAV